MPPNASVVNTPSHKCLAEPSALLKTPPENVVDVRATGSQDAGVVEPTNNKRWSLQGDLEDTITSNEEEKKTGKKADAFDVGDDYDLQCH